MGNRVSKDSKDFKDIKDLKLKKKNYYAQFRLPERA